MGLLAENLLWMLEIVEPKILAVPGTLSRKSMIELGNQFAYIWSPPFDGYPLDFVASGEPPWPVAKGMFEKLGFTHTSVDVNGKDGAVQMDLSLPQELPPADFVTDFGTSEHVPDLYECQRNIWNFCRPGGYIFQVNPAPGNWPGHGRHYRDFPFYEELISVLPAVNISLRHHYACGNTKDGWNTWCCYQKVNGPFISRERFEKIKVYAE